MGKVYLKGRLLLFAVWKGLVPLMGGLRMRRKIQTRKLWNSEAEILLRNADGSFPKDRTLETYVQEKIEKEPGDTVNFYWRGGEPLKAGLVFFAQAVWLQRKFGAGRQIYNLIQTDGTLLDEEWCRFFRQNDFAVGLYLDGPQSFHDGYLQAAMGRQNWQAVMAALHRLNQYQVPYNVVCRVTRASVQQPLKLYRFFKNAGVKYMRFIPLLRDVRVDQRILRQAGLSRDSIEKEELKDWCIQDGEYRTFLQKLFTCWAERDIGWIYVMNIEGALGSWTGRDEAVQRLAEICGDSLVMKHSGVFLEHAYYRYPSDQLKEMGKTAVCGAELVPHYMKLMKQLMRHYLPGGGIRPAAEAMMKKEALS